MGVDEREIEERKMVINSILNSMFSLVIDPGYNDIQMTGKPPNSTHM